MDMVIPTIALFFAIGQFMERQPVYEIEHFYYYSADHKQTALPLTGKVFAPSSENLQKFLHHNRDIKWVAHRVPFWEEGVLFQCQSNQQAINLLKRLHEKKISGEPVVRWNGMDCIPGNWLVVKTKPHVTQMTLINRLKASGKLTVKSLLKMDDYTYQVEIGNLYLPPNMLVVANMLAEDTAWFDHARVGFWQLYSQVSASTVIESPADATLAEERVLKLTISVHKPSIKLRKDMLPVLGQNNWFPTPIAANVRDVNPAVYAANAKIATDSVWHDLGQPSYKTENTDDGYVLTITQPFRFCAVGAVVIPKTAFIYENGNEKFQAIVQPTFYANSSILGSITDIQPISKLGSFQPVPEPDEPYKNPYAGSMMTVGGLIVSGCALLFLALILFGEVRRIRAANLHLWNQGKMKSVLWDELEAAIFHLEQSGESGWLESYRSLSFCLAKVLSEFYDLRCPHGAMEYKGFHIQEVIAELEMMYKDNYNPDEATIARLAINARMLLMEERAKFNV